VQVLDQQIAPARAVAQQVLHLAQGLRVGAAALGGFALALAAGALHGDGDDGMVHGGIPVCVISLDRAAEPRFVGGPPGVQAHYVI
jgi:hypothetical protein